MTTTKYSKQNQETAAGPQGSFVQDDLVHLRFELFVGTSAEAYITYFKFNRCTINLCVRPSMNAFDIASPQRGSSETPNGERYTRGALVMSFRVRLDYRKLSD